MTRKTNSVHDMDIDEVSLVDVPANPYAAVMIQKNHQEADMPDDDAIVLADDEVLYDAEGVAISDDHNFAEGEIAYREDGQAVRISVQDVEDAANADDLVGSDIGKSAFFGSTKPEVSPIFKGLAEQLRDTVAKSAAGSETKALVSKAAAAIEAAERTASQAIEVAKSERDIRLTREFTEVAKGYNVPADPAQLGGVLMRMAETMTDADCAVIHKALTSAGEIIFAEIGITGGGTEDGSDPMAGAEAHAASQIAKGAETKISKAQAVQDYFLENEDAYTAYVNSKR